MCWFVKQIWTNNAEATRTYISIQAWGYMQPMRLKTTRRRRLRIMWHNWLLMAGNILCQQCHQTNLHHVLDYTAGEIYLLFFVFHSTWYLLSPKYCTKKEVIEKFPSTNLPNWCKSQIRTLFSIIRNLMSKISLYVWGLGFEVWGFGVWGLGLGMWLVGWWVVRTHTC